MKSSILLESGTGELETLVFEIGQTDYCINVLKAKEIIYLSSVTKALKTDPAILGLTTIRGAIFPIIDLKYILTGESVNLSESICAIMCEFNGQQYVFTADRVKEIKRVKSSSILPPPPLCDDGYIIGTFLVDESIYSLIDLEGIVSNLGANKVKGDSSLIEKTESMKRLREEKTIFFAEDSALIREAVKGVLAEAGYSCLTCFKNGKEALDALQNMKKHGEVGVDLLVTDIEMPLLDGLTLIRTMKEDEKLKHVPTIIHSSLITGDLIHKGQAVGANGHAAKPNVDKLVEQMDKLLFDSEKK